MNGSEDLKFSLRHSLCKVGSRETDWSNSEKFAIARGIKKLLEKGVIQTVTPSADQFLSNIFLVPKPDGTQRFILNLKKLNEFINAEHFKIEDWRVARSLIEPIVLWRQSI